MMYQVFISIVIKWVVIETDKAPTGKYLHYQVDKAI
jgi:hypothetical protein